MTSLPNPSMLRRLAPDEISDQDVLWIIRGISSYHGGHTAAHIIEDACNGLMQIWRVEGAAEGLVVTQVLQHPAGKELFIFALAGKGLLAAAKAIYEDLEIFARRCECRWIGGQALRPGLGRVYERVLGATPKATVWLKEIT